MVLGADSDPLGQLASSCSQNPPKLNPLRICKWKGRSKPSVVSRALRKSAKLGEKTHRPPPLPPLPPDLVAVSDRRNTRARDAKRFLERYKRVDMAIDAYYNDPAAMAAAKRHESSGVSLTSRLTTLFEQYKGEEILVFDLLKTASLLTPLLAVPYRQIQMVMTSHSMEPSSSVRT